MRPPRRFQELHLQLRSVDEELQHQLGRRPTVAELADRMGASTDDVLEALEAGSAYRSESLDAPPPSADRAAPQLGERLESHDPGFERSELRVLLADAMQDLSERDRTIIHLRFFVGMTQPEIAAEVGVSQSYLSRVLRRALEDLRQRMDP